jgi:hypothetical protein
LDKLLGERPSLATDETNSQDHSIVDNTFSSKGDGARAEKAFAECTESLPRGLDPAVDIIVLRSVSGDKAAEVLETSHHRYVITALM